ncbi:MAG: peptidase S41, partial [Bacteroidetes bacterium HGW-Bacteroidetes-22]
LGNIPFSTVIKPGIGYISLERFTQGATRDVKNAFDKLSASDSLTGLIIDLRGNGGGLLNEAVGICNLFVGKGQHIVSTKGRFQSRSQEYGTTLEAVAPNLPLVILVNGTSASASEIVAGALQDIDRAVIIGDKTYGKGLVQNIVPLPYNAQVKITVAKYYIPSGRCIQAIDYQNRDSEGKGLAIPDQLHKSFTTKGGRFVRDAGGIEPDIKIDTSNAYLRLSSIITGLYLFDFSTIYASQHETIAKAADFISNDQLFESFYGYLERNNYPMTSDLQKYFKDFSDVYTNNGTDSLLQISYNRMVEDFKANALSEVRKNKELVKDWLKIEIVSRYYGQRGRIEAAIGSNQAVSAAIRVLTDKSAYDSILAGTYPACHNKKH